MALLNKEFKVKKEDFERNKKEGIVEKVGKLIYWWLFFVKWTVTFVVDRCLCDRDDYYDDRNYYYDDRDDFCICFCYETLPCSMPRFLSF